MPAMPRSRFKLPPLKLAESGHPGERIAVVRKAHGMTQAQLAKRIGVIQSLISDYESGRRRLYAEMLIRLAHALHVSVDELLGVKAARSNGHGAVSLKVSRRMQQIDTLPRAKQKVLLATIDDFLRGATRQ
jgi:transcriptional regulator with XRE-family HTH domain